MSLYESFINNTGRTIHKIDHYFPIYERHFGKLVEQSPTFMEIGCGFGGSLQMWRHYFGSGSKIIGIDNRPECKQYESDNIHVRIGDQSDETFLSSVADEFGPIDAVLDDGSHLGPDQIVSFNTLYRRLKPEGIYMVEDLHCAYMPNFHGGLNVPTTFIEFAKPKIDSINGEGTLIPGTVALHVYDSIVVFERGIPPWPRKGRAIPSPT